jgi:endonuclease III
MKSLEHVSRLEGLLSDLRRFYGLLPSPPRDPFALFVWEVLSAHSTPVRRDKALAGLKRLRALTPDAMWRTPRKTLEDVVKLAGPHAEGRLHNLRAGIDIFRGSPELPATIRGPLAPARRALRGLPQMSEGGAHRMLLFAADHPVLPVDARVRRVARRLGYAAGGEAFSKTARSVREAVARELPATVETYRRTFLYLAHHGSMTCAEAQPHCPVCPVSAGCPEGRKRLMIGD